MSKNDSVTTICYGREKEWGSRQEAIRFFMEGIAECEGSEQSRYITIVFKLQRGARICSDDPDEF